MALELIDVIDEGDCDDDLTHQPQALIPRLQELDLSLLSSSHLLPRPNHFTSSQTHLTTFSTLQPSQPFSICGFPSSFPLLYSNDLDTFSHHHHY